MTTIIIAVAAAAGGFVFGVLFGRRNKKSVEIAVAEVQKDIELIKSKLK